MIERTIGLEEDATFYRVIAPSYASMPLSGMGAARQGGRFNRPGQEALYLALTDATALAEYRQDNPWLRPGTICTFFVRQLRVADLSGGFDPARWPALWADYAVDWREEWFGHGIEPPTWYMADDTILAGLDGILFPSQSYPGGTNLVIYGSSTRSHNQLRVYDPDNTLSTLRGLSKPSLP